MSDYPDGTDYVEPKLHPNTDLWRDIPTGGEFVKVTAAAIGAAGKDKFPMIKGKKKWWRRTGRGAISLPVTASRLAEHAELVGYVLDPSRALIKYIDPVRGGKSLTSPGDWVDVDAPAPPPSPVNQLAAVAGSSLAHHELVELRQRLDEQISGGTEPL